MITWKRLRFETLRQKSGDVVERVCLEPMNNARPRLRFAVPRKFSAKPVDQVEQENLEITATRNAWKFDIEMSDLDFFEPANVS